jgi:hypothetical protein
MHPATSAIPTQDVAGRGPSGMAGGGDCHDPQAPQPASRQRGAEAPIEFHKVPPQEAGPGYRSWYGRGQNFVLCYTEAEAGAVLSRSGQIDEYMAFCPDEATIVDIDTERGRASDVHHSLAIVPPGTSAITIKRPGAIVRLFSAQSPDLAALASNAACYARPNPNIAPFEPWPSPPDGFRLRLYPIAVPPTPGRFGVIFRSTNLMINLFPVATKPRDPTRMSPHSHDDFEQCSLTLQGDYIHYLRWPWTADRLAWRDDAAIRCTAPSMTVIPPTVIHTSQSLEPPCQLVDIFSPPRLDFSRKQGWVLNADDYPMPLPPQG